ncbi:hypothetical protein [Carboxylicivirga taeanensis]|uniref:hypothetical protein n=1 Tax=Carboxylicivirga taeanensis TaxID=1416875 RepID=UPI003F6DD089
MKKTLILSFLFAFTLAITTPALAATMDQEPVKTEQKKEDKKKKECNEKKSCEEKKACSEKKACCSEKKEKKS